MNTQGRFIVFEGGEGTGKTTQLKLLEQKLREKGFLVFVTREPGGNGSEIAEKIRTIIKDPDHKNMAPETELFLFLAARAQHVQKHIRPHLELSYIVICDRFFGSTLAYQHFGRGLFNLEEVKRINDFATGGLQPDLTILLDIDPEIGLARKKDQQVQCRLDNEKLEFHEKVRKGYLNLSETNKDWQIISAENEIDSIHENIWSHVSRLLEIV
ncbi:dTMP kinase [Patescibacteria group bacterium]|nr:dTMP kinase [Patescibacteria group bacterium]